MKSEKGWCPLLASSSTFDRRSMKKRLLKSLVSPSMFAISCVLFDHNSLPAELAGPGVSPRESEVFRQLRARLRYFNVDRDIRSVLVTSATPEEGKSTVAWNLARAAAASSQAVLVEADLRNPSLAATQALFPNPGLAELLTHQVRRRLRRHALAKHWRLVNRITP